MNERGPGTLDHPRYGRLTVVPFGTITQRDDLVSKANESAIEVTFYDTLNIIFPTSLIDPKAELLTSIDNMGAVAGGSFASGIITKTAGQIAAIRGNFNTAISTISNKLKPLYQAGADVNREMMAVVDSANQSVTVLVGEPLAFASQIFAMAKIPAAAQSLLSDRVAAYTDLARSLYADIQIPSDSPDPNIRKNKFLTGFMSLQGSITGFALSMTNTAFKTKEDVASAVDVFSFVQYALANITDSEANDNGYVDTGENHQAMMDMITKTNAYLLTIAFDLPQQRAIILDRDRTIIDLSAELYGVVDAKLDDIIENNNLNGDDILELKQGKRIIYFV